MSTADYANSLAKNSTGLASANLNVDPALYTGLIERSSWTRLQRSEQPVPVRRLRPMPAAVGAGSFWIGMTDWITGKSTQDTLDFIEKSLADVLIAQLALGGRPLVGLAPQRARHAPHHTHAPGPGQRDSAGGWREDQSS